MGPLASEPWWLAGAGGEQELVVSRNPEMVSGKCWHPNGRGDCVRGWPQGGGRKGVALADERVSPVGRLAGPLAEVGQICVVPVDFVRLGNGCKQVAVGSCCKAWS